MTIDTTIDGSVLVITVNRPQVLNAVDMSTRAALRAAWQRLGDDAQLRAAVLTGAGSRAFCVGSDLKEPVPDDGPLASTAFGPLPNHHLLHGLDGDKPVVCAINGLALGGGLEIALGCDIRIAAGHAEFGLPETRVGSIPGSGGTQLLPRIVGHSMAAHMLLTGDRIDAATALSCGLISEIVDEDQVLPRAVEIAHRIAANAPLAVRAVKRLLRRESGSLADGLAAERAMFSAIRTTDDRAEGRRAFAEKRPPRFTGA